MLCSVKLSTKKSFITLEPGFKTSLKLTFYSIGREESQVLCFQGVLMCEVRGSCLGLRFSSQ